MGAYLNQFKTAMLAQVLPLEYRNSNNTIFTVDSLRYNSTDSTVTLNGLINSLPNLNLPQATNTINNTLSKLPVVGPFLVKSYRVRTYPRNL